MLGFNPISDKPISDIGLSALTCYISVTDENDTCLFIDEESVEDYILTTDQDDTGALNTSVSVSTSISSTDANDTANLVATTLISSLINVTDQDDTALLQASVTGGQDFHDGFTEGEIRRAKALDKRLAIARQKLVDAQKAQKLARKQAIRDLVDPKVIKEVEISKEIALKPIIRASKEIKYLEIEQNILLNEFKARQELARLQTQQYLVQLQQMIDDDEEDSVLALLL